MKKKSYLHLSNLPTYLHTYLLGMWLYQPSYQFIPTMTYHTAIKPTDTERHTKSIGKPSKTHQQHVHQDYPHSWADQPPTLPKQDSTNS